MLVCEPSSDRVTGDSKFKVLSCYIMSPRTAWATYMNGTTRTKGFYSLMENKINWLKRQPTFVRKKVLLPTISRIYGGIKDTKTSKASEEIVIKRKRTDEKWTWKQLLTMLSNQWIWKSILICGMELLDRRTLDGQGDIEN